MQDVQNVQLHPGARDSEATRIAQDESLRRRNNHSGGGGGVQFATIFSMIDGGLDSAAESLRKLPKRGSQKDSEEQKGSELPMVAVVEAKAAAPEAPKEAPKAKSDQEQKASSVKESTAKRSEAADKAVAAAAIAEAKTGTKVDQKVAVEQIRAAKVEPQQAKAVEKPRAQEKAERRAEVKEVETQARQDVKGPVVLDRGPSQEPVKVQERRNREKEKATDVHGQESREQSRAAEKSQGNRVDDDSARTPKLRDRPEANPVQREKPAAQEAKPVERRPDDIDVSDRRRTEERGGAEGASKKRSISDLEKLTGLDSRTVVEVAAALAVPAPDAGIRVSTDVASKGIAIDSVKAPAKAAPASQSSNAQQHSGGADAQTRSAQTQEKLGQTAKRLASYLSGNPESVAMKPEATFTDMVAKAKLFVENGRSEMTLQLKPEQLGSLKIQMVVEDGKMQAHFVTDRAEVKELIEQNADLLKTKLAEAGIEVNMMSVEVRSDAGTAHPQDSRPSGLRKVTEFGSGDDSGLPTGGPSAEIAYAMAGMGTHLSLVG